MPLITETYYLSLTQDNRGILRLRCSQDDTFRTVNLKLYNNGSIFVIPSGVSASISGVKQNGAVFSKPCTISQDRENVVLQLSSDITNVDGIIVAEIVLNDGEGGRLGTSNFIIQVEKNPIRAGVVQDTETPIEYINDFIEKIQTLTARLNNLITPSGDPSLAEVVDARIGILDSTTYQTLGARLNAEFQRLSNALNGVTILESTGDTTDRTSEILSKLNTYGTCKLGKGDFYVKNLVMPEDSMLVGSGNSTRVVLLGSETNTYIVKPKSGCIIENISFYGGFTGTYSELIAVSDARRHCIILDKFNDVNSENVILSNISISNFVGSAIVQRYTTGCHCKDVVINMCYAGIDISNASYDGQCANAYISNTKFGIVQNGSNFIFTNCVSKDSIYHIMSDQQNTECTFSSCSFSESSLETTSKLASISNARAGVTFDNCIFDSSLSMLLNACDGIVIKGTNFVGSDTFAITVSNGRNTLLLITDCIADVEPTVTNAGTAARITSCYLKDGTAWSISEADITVDDELSDESENPIQNRAVASAISEINESLGALIAPPRLNDNTDLDSVIASGVYMLHANSAYLNKPTQDAEHGILEVWREKYGDNAGRFFQRLTYTYKEGRTNSEIWVRSKSAAANESWTTWICISNISDGMNRRLRRLVTALINIFKDIPYIKGDSEKYINEIASVLEGEKKTLISVSATYDANVHTVYPWNALDSLRGYIIVTAYYDDGSNETVTEFSLYGKLTNANSIITVDYLTQTTTITVPVTIDESLAYYLTSGSSLSGLDSINTNIMLGDTNKSVTIIGDVTDDEVPTRVRTIILASDRDPSIKDAGFQVFLNTIDNNGSYEKKYALIGCRSVAQSTQGLSNASHRIKFALIHYANTTKCTMFLKVDETVILNWIQVDGIYVASNQTLYIGARPDGGYNWKGRIDLLNVYTRGLSMTEAKSLLGEGE